jgi:hypothetical protein
VRSRPVKYWAFQANPTQYRVLDAIRRCAQDTWKVDRGDVQPGDRALIWRSQGRDGWRGVVAFAEVLSFPHTQPTAHPEYYIDPDDRKMLVQRATIRYVLLRHLPLIVNGRGHDTIENLTASPVKPLCLEARRRNGRAWLEPQAGRVRPSRLLVVPGRVAGSGKGTAARRQFACHRAPSRPQPPAAAPSRHQPPPAAGIPWPGRPVGDARENRQG